MATPSITCDCGHPSTPDAFTPGYAVDAWGKSHCYQCAADIDKAKAQAMTPGDEPLFTYLKAERIPAPRSSVTATVTTWAGVELGTAVLYRGDRSDNQMRVVAVIGDRRFWGRTPTHNGNYTRLRPYRKQ
jgi:hypothetical protein